MKRTMALLARTAQAQASNMNLHVGLQGGHLRLKIILGTLEVLKPDVSQGIFIVAG